jgi:hypothetical protein
MTAPQSQFLRASSLKLTGFQRVLDLSQMHFKFEVRAADVQSPNSAAIRVYNLSDKNAPGATADTIGQIIGGDGLEYIRVELQAGYQGTMGVIFEGQIKQFRYGRENQTDTYLDLLCADGDLAYNFGVCKATQPPGATPLQRVSAVVAAMQEVDPSVAAGYIPDFTPQTQIRPKVQFGMARDVLRQEMTAQGMTWSIQRGDLTVIPLTSFVPGEVTVMNSRTGMIGMPEQTDHGIAVRCLINPKLAVGKLVQINNKDVNQLINSVYSIGPVQYNTNKVLQYAARVNPDGYYRIYVVEHIGDTRGQEWYTELTCLGIVTPPANPLTAAPGTVLSYG